MVDSREVDSLGSGLVGAVGSGGALIQARSGLDGQGGFFFELPQTGVRLPSYQTWLEPGPAFDWKCGGNRDRRVDTFEQRKWTITLLITNNLT
jgi:hypothetical protein